MNEEDKRMEVYKRWDSPYIRNAQHRTVPILKMHNVGTVPMLKMLTIATSMFYDLCLELEF